VIELRFEFVIAAREDERGDAAMRRLVQHFLMLLAIELVQAAARLNNFDR
jgi:hypothetical protein